MSRVVLAACVGALTAAALCAAEPATLTYPGSGADLPVSFAYSADWRLTEELGAHEAYHAVRLQGPRNAENTYTPYLVIRAFPVQPPGSRWADRRVLTNHLLTTLPDGANVETQTIRSMASTSADDFTFTHTIPPLHHAKHKTVKVPVKTRTVVAEQGPFLYEITYSADERDYETYLAGFEALLASLQFHLKP